MKSPAPSGILDIMREIVRHPLFSLAKFAALTLAVMAPLTLPIRSQQTPRSNRIQTATIFQLQAPTSGPQQNPSPSSNSAQAPASTPSEEGARLTVVLDPAHGGVAFGARGPTGLAERDVVMDFSCPHGQVGRAHVPTPVPP